MPAGGVIDSLAARLTGLPPNVEGVLHGAANGKTEVEGLGECQGGGVSDGGLLRWLNDYG